MTSNRRIRGLSALTRSLLAGGEGDEVDFKKVPDGISQDDLVAFANSDTGGTILVGVVEQDADGAQVGAVKGCDVSDATILLITNKAVTCIPPVSIEIAIENLSSQPILRIAIPASPTRPHCTARGVYNRRDGSRNRPLHPSELLRIFLENEGRVFAERFESAADRIAADLTKLEASLDTSVKNMADQLGWAESKMDDTESKLDDLVDQITDLERPMKIIGERIRTIFRQDKRDDPVSGRELKKLTQSYAERIRERADLLELIKGGGSITLRKPAEISQELEQEDAEKALADATAIILRQEDLNKYEICCKAPSEFSECELNDFYSIITEGGRPQKALEARVAKAVRIGLIRYEGITVGTAGLSKPPLPLRRTIFLSAVSSADPTTYPYELGWIHLAEGHRGKGQVTRLIAELMPMAEDKGLFSTAGNGNEVMNATLRQLHFLQDGNEFRSKKLPGETLQLFLLDQKRSR